MNPPSAPRFSLVAPTFNEHANITGFMARASATLDARLPGDYEIIIVDDDSPDRTWQVAGEAARAFPRVRVLRRRNERGLATAVVAGWRAARGEWLGVIDADLQHPPEAIARLLDAVAAGADLAVGSRHVAGGGVSTWSAGRRLVSRGAQWLGLLALPATRQVSDPMSGFFIVRREVLDLSSLAPLGYKILLEVLVRSRARRPVEVGYVFEERRLGGSKANLRIYWQYLRHLWRLRRAAGSEGHAD
jgi:dolichol-phosphate mannosyltransferase